ncbi:MAG: HupE/UreJ family protein [Nanoarchaeota archaeon]|nr:HupE/UreJ family protein [DPANN group archaeon]MBL7117131.1 HupE/UreJ family protein [Nanoarchaeota archaeon]
MLKKTFLIPIFFIILVYSANAHPLDVVYSEIFVKNSSLNYSIKVSSVYLSDILGLDNIEQLNKESIDERIVQEYFDDNLEISSENEKCNSQLKRISLEQDYNKNPQSPVFFHFDASCKEQINYLEITSTLFSEYSYSKTFMTDVYYKNKTQNLIIGYADKVVLPILLDEEYAGEKIKTGNLARAANFIKLGIHHIFIGYDHIAFLIGIIIIIISFKQAVKIVTAFTIAHSITLILSALDIFTIPQMVAEAIIALSIAYVGFENLYFKEIKRRWLVAFSFGLFHGFGFSSVLKEIGIPKDFAIVSLLSFNVGVEIGQIVIVALILPMIWYIRRYKWHGEFKKTISGTILVLGIYWLITRTFLLV